MTTTDSGRLKTAGSKKGYMADRSDTSVTYIRPPRGWLALNLRDL